MRSNHGLLAETRVESLKIMPRDRLDKLALEYAQQHGDGCALRTWSGGNVWIVVVVAEVLLLAGLHGWLMLTTVVVLSLTLAFFVLICFRLLVVLLGMFRNPQIEVSEQQLQDFDDDQLPAYTILVPLYHEAAVAQGIVQTLQRLEYPRDRLQILLLLEDDDDVTWRALQQVTLSSEFSILRVPSAEPRTKPRACNHGLSAATGEFLVIYDAEDRPDADQLRKTAWAFRNAEAGPTLRDRGTRGDGPNRKRRTTEVVCIQAKLNYYNARQNFLTRCFAIEYTAWFDLWLPGLQALRGPIPLGGTSNHFRTAALRQLGGWDPFNVTEDCDLGVRLAVAGLETRLIDSTTWEEANSRTGNWIRQRSRWVKGYLQTHLVHTKQPFKLLRSLGCRGTLLFLFSVGGTAVAQLLNLVCLPIVLLYFSLLLADVIQGREVWIVLAGSRDEYRLAWQMLYLEAGETPAWSVVSIVGFVGSVLMLLSNVVFVLINLLACRIRSYHDLWLAALLSPVYWLLGSVAAWKGVWQLLTRPHYWEKTTHGLTAE